MGVPVLSSCQVLIVSLRNLTEPSQKAKFAPPGWKLVAAFRNAPPSVESTTPVESALLKSGYFFWTLIGKNVVNAVSP